MPSLLAISIPTFNRADYLGELLNCLCGQINLLQVSVSISVFDNASTDRTNELVRKTQSVFPFLKYYRHPTNIGGVANILRCVEFADAEWVWVLPDDCILPDKSIETILQRLETAAPPLVYARCTSWCDDTDNTAADIRADSLFLENSCLWQRLAWLPCLVLHRESVHKYIPASYRLAGFSYPHLVLALSAVKDAPCGSRISTVPAVFSCQKNKVYTTKRYTWIHGALWNFAKTIRACVDRRAAHRILRQSAKSERWGKQVLAHIPAEFEVIPASTPWDLIEFYGVYMLPALILYIWLRYIPKGANRLVFSFLSALSAKGPFARTNKYWRNLKQRISVSSDLDLNF
jgi:glycosyltransferase involved in cell wall biosynthesis